MTDEQDRRVVPLVHLLRWLTPTTVRRAACAASLLGSRSTGVRVMVAVSMI